MFSRYKKSAAPQPAASTTAPVKSLHEAPAAPASGGPRSLVSRRPGGQPGVQPSAQAIAADKERKRKERMSELKVELHKSLLDNLNLAALESATEADLRQEIVSISTEVLEGMSIVLNKEERSTLFQELYDEVMGLGPLEPLLKDETVNDILVNGPQQIFVERDGKLTLTDITFKDERHLLRIIDKIVSGGTGSGKTTTLNALSSFIDNAERILTIEDTAELQLQQVHVGRMESRPANVEGKGAVTQRDCLRNALRMRPDRIIVGETRGEEVIDMLQAMNTGHDGSMTTIHANSARDGVSRLENMIAMAGIEMPIKAVRAQIASAVNLIVQASRLQDGSRRMVSITEITGMEGDVISMQEIFRYERLGLAPDGKIIGRFTATGVRSHFAERFRQWGFDLPASIYVPIAAE